MADKSVGELIAAQSVTPTDLFVLEQNGTAKKLTGQILENWLVSFADGHGGIQSIVKIETNVLADTYRITLADTTTFDFVVTNGRGVNSITKKSTSGLVDTYTITYNDGTTGTFTVTNGAKGDQGDNAYIWVKYASQEPTSSDISLGDIPDEWMGIYFGTSSTAPDSYSSYKWYKIKGEKGDTGDPATVVSNVVEYQTSDSGTIIPSGVWRTSIPVVAQGRYLWTRTTTTFNTGSSAVSYSVSRMGIDGTGSVSSVANIPPDGNGNVPLTAADIGALPNSGGDMTGGLRMNGQPISGLNAPAANDQAANMGFVNQQVRKAAPHNLLDNSDFRNPVNHRGLTSYIGDSYTIDRWASLNTNNIITVSDGGIRFQTTGAGVFRQNLDVGNKYAGKKLTLAMKTIDGTIHCCSGTMVDAVDATFVARSATEGIRVELYGMNNSVMVQFFDTDGDVTIEWATLYEGEYTLDTLPEYQSKGYGAELAECQRYLQRFRTETERKTYCEDFRPTMHLTPNGVVSKFEQNIDGVTHYFASAEL